MKVPDKLIFAMQDIEHIERNWGYDPDKVVGGDVVEYIRRDEAIKSCVERLSEYQIIAHDGRGYHGEHYFIREEELTILIERILGEMWP